MDKLISSQLTTTKRFTKTNNTQQNIGRAKGDIRSERSEHILNASAELTLALVRTGRGESGRGPCERCFNTRGKTTLAAVLS